MRTCKCHGPFPTRKFIAVTGGIRFRGNQQYPQSYCPEAQPHKPGKFKNDYGIEHVDP